MYLDGSDLPRVAEANEAPGFSGVGRFIHPPAGDHLGPHAVRASAGIDDVGIGIGDVDGAHGSGLEVLAGDIHPVMTVIGGLPHTATDAAHVEGARLAGHAGDSGDPAAAGGADIAVFHSFIKGGVEDDVGAR